MTANLAVAAAAGATGGMVADQVAAGGNWWLPLLPLVLTLGMASAFAREHSRATGLRGAIDTTRTVHAADGPVEALQIMVREIAGHFDAVGAELHRLPQDGGSPARFSVGRTDQSSEVFRGETWRDDGGPGLTHAVPLLEADHGTALDQRHVGQVGRDPLRRCTRRSPGSRSSTR